VGSVASLQPVIAAAEAVDYDTDVLLAGSVASAHGSSLQGAVEQLLHPSASSSSGSSSSSIGGTAGGQSTRVPKDVKSEFSVAEQQLLLEFRAALLEAFSEVFQIELEASSSEEVAGLHTTQGAASETQQQMALVHFG
jgi:hypothetical protein